MHIMWFIAECDIISVLCVCVVVRCVCACSTVVYRVASIAVHVHGCCLL